MYWKDIFEYIDHVELFYYLCSKLKLIPITGIDVNGKYYFAFDNIRIMDENFMYLPDTGYSWSEDTAAKKLIRACMKSGIKLRKKTSKGEIYFTNRFKKAVKSYCRKAEIIEYVQTNI